MNVLTLTLNIKSKLCKMAEFAPKTGCPMCGIVASASHVTPNSPSSESSASSNPALDLLWRDDNFTAYREKANPVSSKGHVIIAFKYGLFRGLSLKYFTDIIAAVSTFHQFTDWLRFNPFITCIVELNPFLGLLRSSASR